MKVKVEVEKTACDICKTLLELDTTLVCELCSKEVCPKHSFLIIIKTPRTWVFGNDVKEYNKYLCIQCVPERLLDKNVNTYK